jgi:hypothetical protein
MPREIVVRRFSSNDKPYEIPPNNVPAYWIRPQQMLSNAKGAHRFVWDLHYTPLNTPPNYPIGAVYMNTAPDPTSPWVMPGTYTVTLSANGRTYQQPLTVVMDPRIKTTTAELQLQHDLALDAHNNQLKLTALQETIRKMRKGMEAMQNNSALSSYVTALTTNLDDIMPARATPTQMSVGRLQNAFGSIKNLIIETEMPVTATTKAAMKQSNDDLRVMLMKWDVIKYQLNELNAAAKKAGLAPIEL